MHLSLPWPGPFSTAVRSSWTAKFMRTSPCCPNTAPLCTSFSVCVVHLLLWKKQSIHSPTNPSRGCFHLMRMSVKIQRMCLDGKLVFSIVDTLYCLWIVWSLCACLMQWCQGIDHTKMNFLPLFTLHHVFVPNLWDFLYSVEHRRCFEKCVSDFQCNIYCIGHTV